MRVLLVEDDELEVEMLSKALRTEGYALDTAGSCRAAEVLLDLNDYDLLLLDWNLPDEPGIRLCERIRARGRSLPVLFLTVRSAEEDLIAALDAGADDYLVKPYSVRELRARIRALLRRQPVILNRQIAVSDLVIDLGQRQVRRGGCPIPLAPKEYAVLEYLACHAGRVVSRAELCNHIWDDNHDPASHTLEVHINTLRSKLAGASGTWVIRTHRGQGYMLEAPEDLYATGSFPGVERLPSDGLRDSSR